MTKAEELRRINELVSTYGERGLAALVVSLEKSLDRRPPVRAIPRRLLDRAATALDRHGADPELAAEIWKYLET